MLPYLAQGANSSLEDGAVLGYLLGSMSNKTQLPQILRLYEGLRKSRGEAIVRETFKQVCILPPLPYLPSWVLGYAFLGGLLTGWMYS